MALAINKVDGCGLSNNALCTLGKEDEVAVLAIEGRSINYLRTCSNCYTVIILALNNFLLLVRSTGVQDKFKFKK